MADQVKALSEREVERVEVRLAAWDKNDYSQHNFPVTAEQASALIATVKVLRADLKYRCEALEELRSCRDRWLTMLHPTNADETVDAAIHNVAKTREWKRSRNESSNGKEN